VILVNIFAFFGIQGASSFYSIFWVMLLSASIDTPSWGPHSSSSQFATLSCVFFFVMIGGTGSTLCLNLVMLRARSEQIRKLGIMSFIPSLMNANDLIIYGLPVAFNRYLIIPFFLVPLVNVWITYGAYVSGFMNSPELFLPPYLPAPLGAFMSCGADWKALLICLINLIVGAAIYSFFLSPYDLKAREQEDIPDEDARVRRAPM
jgi:cellobiose PTS system EIIC component